MEQSMNAQLVEHHRKRLARLKDERERFGRNTPPEILIEIDDLEAEIARLEATARTAVETGGGAFIGGNVQVAGVRVRGDQVAGAKVGGDMVISSGTTVAEGSIVGTVIRNIGGETYTISFGGPSGTDLDRLLAPVFSAINQTPVENQAEAKRLVQNLREELLLGRQADDIKMARLIDTLSAAVPGATSPIVSMFASPLLSGLSGPVTKYVLEKFQGR